VRYHIEQKIYRPRLSIWRVILGLFFAGLTFILIRYMLTDATETDFVAGSIAILVIGTVAFFYNYYLYTSHFSHNTPNGMSGLGLSFSPDEINREIAALDFKEVLENTGIYTAGKWIALQPPKDEQFILLPVGMVRFVTYNWVLRNNSSDDIGEKYNDYTFTFYLTNGRISEYQIPLEYYSKKPSISKVNSRAVEEKFYKVYTIFLNIFYERLIPTISDAWLFLYRAKKLMLEDSFEHHRKNRLNQDIFEDYVEFFPLDTMQIEEERHHALPPNKAVLYLKVTAWLALIICQLLCIRLDSPEPLTRDDQALTVIIHGIIIAAGAVMLVIYTYEIIRTMIHRKRARDHEKRESTWLKGIAYWYVRRESSVILKLLNIVFWGWMMIRNLKYLM
jgi:hypothetical protein